jgi:hypothetical protein
MSVVYGYVIGEAVPNGQEEVVKGYCCANRLKLRKMFRDSNPKGAWLSRPEGRKLAGVLQPHDAIVVADLGAVYSSPRALLGAVELLKAKDAVLHVARFVSGDSLWPEGTSSLVITGEIAAGFVKALQIAAAFKYAIQSECITEALASKKAADPDGKHCHHPGYGFAWRRGKRVEHAAEREQMAAIVRYRQDGYSFNDIYFHFLKHRIKTKGGKEWSTTRLRAAYKAALAMGLGGTSPAQPAPSQS